jgi:hypothetical protein
MTDDLDALILDLLESIGTDARPYAEVFEAWRTSCPRLPVWEEATDRGLLAVHFHDGSRFVSVTPRGRELLDERRPAAIR